ncbi:hypothetical protein SAMN06295905_1343 [Devosia lucknowensis]|uniref:Uncharacterized protein n=1 Tax=Devosia lucknowensis TaxID=1096929 RepID=A0A1Y6ET50_9HYPH|nr:hypothetical protein [Devosia lucknowensis]SMQ65894.1 hypothetical protein SAMN06295905_1343 [Devosia lucknowensis]
MPTARDKARKRKTASYIGAGVVPKPVEPEEPADPEGGEGEGD